MIAVSTVMVFYSVVLSFALGILSGLIYALVRRIFSAVSRRNIGVSKRGKIMRMLIGFVGHFYDFISVFLTGIALMILIYVSADGVVDIYSLISVFLGFFLSKSFVYAQFWKKGKNKL